jgi:hypothetical protein
MYTFLLVSPTGSIPNFEFAFCPDEESARRTAERLLDQQPERLAVEVWNERERVGLVQRGA